MVDMYLLLIPGMYENIFSDHLIMDRRRVI